MDYSFHPEAAAELDEAIAHYDTQQAGLGREFLDEIVRASHSLRMLNPQQIQPRCQGSARRVA